ncbi:fibroblast growth factor 7 [Corythoichthys intestinalis]|uniref:fibroblast growth factor 7 n=1 Tax=Corythoichthys intestinalis TaxID=161448 RepID=UPI0025A5EECA|nr:fibroblast growth factor 7 [Corythoichthys intestinalis]XP_057699597.1 fibroblast growth factor 7 [Corythoichthys intestinalis]XP_061796839.1 fibroblast growth factor 7-like [Nerophis lumbriciformis]
MRKWMLTWNLPNLFSGLYLHAIFLLGSVCVVYSDCTPAQLAAIMNCSRHERHTRNYDYMEGGDVRIRQLFSRTQWFLTIDEEGNINGTQDPTNCYSILEIRTVSEGGILAIKGIKSQHYISMNKGGQLQGKRTYNENCNFKEVFLENYFNAYSSTKWTKNGREMFIALSQKGRPLRGKRTRREHVASHFIPMKCREEERRTD